MLEKIFSSRSKVRLIRVLVENPRREFCLEDLVKETGLSFGTAHPALKDLVSSRLLVTRKVGRSTLYKINEKSLIFHELEELVTKEKRVMERIAREFVTKLDKTDIKTVVLFGSVARGEATEKSDIDLLFVFKNDEKAKKAIDKHAREFLDKYDVELVPVFLSIRDAEKRFRAADEFILNVIAEGKVLFGDLKWLKR